MKEYRKLQKSDLYRYTGGKHVSFFKKIRFFGWRYMKTWRKANYYRGNNRLLFFFFGFLLHLKSFKFGFQISPSASIGKGFYIGHFGTVVIGDEVIIGDNVNVGINVVIGRTSRGEKKGSPTIGDNVWIGSGSIIVGKISIGSNVLIAPNSYVNFDIPSNSILIGAPNARIIDSKGATDGYIENTIDF